LIDTRDPVPRVRIPILALLTPALLVLAWGVVSSLGLFPPSLFPHPADVARGVAAELASGRLINDVIASLFRVSAGFLLAVALGLPAGLLLGHSTRARAAFLPMVNFFRSLSPLAWIPFAILWLGIGDAPAIFLIFMAAFFPIVLSTTAAVANIPSVYFRVARGLGMAGPRLLTAVTLPAIAPQVITTLRVVAGLSWLVVVAAEMIAGRDGLGFAVWDARNGLRIDLLAAEMLVIGVIGAVLDRVLVQLTRIPSVRWGYER
jgi:NitT/TauT family transport system permease protein